MPFSFVFKQRLDVNPKEESRTFLTFVIPHHKEPLLTVIPWHQSSSVLHFLKVNDILTLSQQRFFGELQDREGEFGISDIQLGLTTLEEVFLNIAKQAELETSTAEGTLVTLNLSSGTTIQVCVLSNPNNNTLLTIIGGKYLKCRYLPSTRLVCLSGCLAKKKTLGIHLEVFWSLIVSL